MLPSALLGKIQRKGSQKPSSHNRSYGCSQPLLRYVLGEQRRIQIVVGMVPYRRRQGRENVLAILGVAFRLDVGGTFSLEAMYEFCRLGVT